MKSLKILFITHEVSRTGAPIILLQFLEWIRKMGLDIEISVLSLKSGDLKEKFQSVSDTYEQLSDYKNIPLTFWKDLEKRFLRKLGISSPNRKEKFLKEFTRGSYDLIYANSIITLPLAKKLKDYCTTTKLLVHVHELPSVIKSSCIDFQSFIPDIDVVISASQLVKNELLKNYAIKGEKIKTIYEFSKIKDKAERKERSENLKFVVGGAGTVHWRKGTDLFIQVGRYIEKKYQNLDIEFIWIGNITDRERIIADADIKKAGLEKKIFFLGEKESPGKYFETYDVFLLTSREDPFPLVTIEIGSLGKPVICFKGATGIEEVLVHGGGYIVPYLDIEEMAEKIVFYYNNKVDLQKDGLKAQLLFSEFSPENQCPKIYKEIKNII